MKEKILLYAVRVSESCSFPGTRASWLRAAAEYEAGNPLALINELSEEYIISVQAAKQLGHDPDTIREVLRLKNMLTFLGYTPEGEPDVPR